MGLIAFLRRLFGGGPPPSVTPHIPADFLQPLPAESQLGSRCSLSPSDSPSDHSSESTPRAAFKPPHSLVWGIHQRKQTLTLRVVSNLPYRFARASRVKHGHFDDLSNDLNVAALQRYNLPILRTPEELAHWLGVPLGRLAWLTGRFFENERPQSAQEAHYHFHWIKKKSGGYRLIEAPKGHLKHAQQQILRGILDQIPAHSASHGFVKGRSIVSNAAPHRKSYWILKLDLSNFYPTVRYSRVVAIFRSLGYCREVAIWLARLTTSAIPTNLSSPDRLSNTVWPYLARHLPQGAPTSPALANLSAFSLDVRLQGVANSYHVRYTRYADDLTFSGKGVSYPALRELIPLINWVIRRERFKLNTEKRRLLRRHQRQTVTGIVVNEKLSLKRPDYDLLKAILTNCIRTGPAAQNRDNHPQFACQLRGRVSHLLSINPERGRRLLALYEQIDWSSHSPHDPE